jgi:hypothetical protein
MEQKGDTMTQRLIYSHDFLKNKMVSIAISHHAPYQGGYIDFLPVKDTSHSNYTGPPRTSLCDDLIYYHNQLNPAPTSLPTPDTAVYFLKKIIAGIWMNSIAYVGTSVSSLEYAVEQSRKHSPSSPPIDGKTTSYGGLEWLEKNLFHIYGWKRRCSQLHDWTDWNLLELDISFSRLKKSSSTDTSTSDIDEQDWLFIKKRLELCETCSRDIVASALSLLSLIESHKSVEEAESARVLALLGTVYLPLSLTAGILSIGGSFTPGQGQFWIFFVVAGPLMVLSLGATYMPIMRDFLSWAMRKGRTEDAGGVKRVPTFVKEGQEPV